MTQAMNILEMFSEEPKMEVKIVRQNNNLSGIGEAKVYLANYSPIKENMDNIDVYLLEGQYHAWEGIKVDFRYDYMMGKVKDTYQDEFKRIMKVTKIQ